jgi:HSP20 family protein
MGQLLWSVLFKTEGVHKPVHEVAVAFADTEARTTQEQSSETIHLQLRALSRTRPLKTQSPWPAACYFIVYTHSRGLCRLLKTEAEGVHMVEKTTGIPRSKRRLATRDELPSSSSPVRTFERVADQIGDFFDEFGFGRRWGSPPFGRHWSERSWRACTGMWAPQIEVREVDDEVVVCADLPGMTKEDVHVDVKDHQITISGERRIEEENERGGFYRSEHPYGSFCRTIKWPEGTHTDQANATLKDGVLEIRLPAPNQTGRRRVEINQNADTRCEGGAPRTHPVRTATQVDRTST